MTGEEGGGGGPKLFTYKPKKAQLKKHLQQHPSSSSSPSPAATSSMASSSSSTPPPPQVPKESFIRRYKYIWPLLLTVNLAIGGYFFMRTTKKKETSVEGGVPTASAAATATATATVAPVVAKPSSSAIVEPEKLREPIPEDQQRELFKWILEEKRKVKTKDPLEKKRIDEEKAIIKQFLRAKSIPPL